MANANSIDELQERMASMRASSLLQVELLREGDIDVLATGEKGWPDIVACVLDDGFNTGKLFAIQLMASWEDIKDYHLDDFTFPLAIFVYDRKTDSFQWDWIIAPEPDGKARKNKIALKTFVSGTMKDIVGQVRIFYTNRKLLLAA